MCQPARCRTCSKTTWTGCGRHVQSVMGRVPEDRRCECPPREARAPRAPRQRGSLLSRLRGGRTAR